MAADSPDPDALERKKRSEVILRARKIPINDWLPFIESKREVTLRGPQDVARRVTVLALIAAKSEDEGWELPAAEILSDRGLADELTPAERKYLASEKQPSVEERAQFTWRYEAAWALLWALGHIDGEEFGGPADICDVPKLSQIVAQTPPEQFIGGAKLRSVDEILDQADLSYRCNWAAVDARVNNRPMPQDIHPGITQERHYAFNWLTQYGDQDWDNVSTDT